MRHSTILIVDDEAANLSILSQLLKSNYTVHAAKDGEQALRVAAREPYPDLILLDVVMPGMDGYTVLSRLREMPELDRIPVIFVTGLSDDVDEERGLQLGAVDYITKPVKPAVLLARVAAHLEIKHSRDRLRDQNDWLEAEVARRMEENQVLEQVTLNVILGLAETRDSDTGNHIARTQAYIAALGERLQTVPGYAEGLTGICQRI
ncbi:MAG: response regulator [Spirochaetaceae bacterium]|nr:MAG: response regulator [Spirochaetaceae bacterium]